MTLLETINTLNWIASQQPNVNAILESGDVFDLNKEEYQQAYSAFCATQQPHEIGLEYTTFNFTLYYVDRLTLDKTNKNEIHSTAVAFFQNFIHSVNDWFPNLNMENGTVTTFTERFSAECAGAFMNCSITTTNQSLCALVYEDARRKGEFAPQEFSDDFFKWASEVTR